MSNMITYDAKSNIGFDFDGSIAVNDDDQNNDPDEIRQIIRDAIDCVAPRYGYQHCEDATSVHDPFAECAISKTQKRRTAEAIRRLL